MRPRKTTLIDLIMNEVALYGGIPLRRYDILHFAKLHLGDRDKEPFGAQYFAFHPPIVDLEPWNREAAAQVFKSDN